MTKGESVKIVVPLLVIAAAAAIGAGAYYYSHQPSPVPLPGPVPGGSGGTCGPSFGTCGDGYVCMQDCGPPVVYEGAPPPGYSCVTKAVASQPRNCPICLASNAMIGTPWGDVSVKDLQAGDVVWSLDPDGKKMAQPVLAVAKTSVSASHQVVDLKLSDGREAWVSPSHPTTDGRLVGELKTGDTYDGASVLSAELVPYWDDATYDLLPDGDTGEYWANGILLKSTLKN